MSPTVTYREINAARVDRAGNLRLYERGRFGSRRQRVFHPAGEWTCLTLSDIDATVRLSTNPRKAADDGGPWTDHVSTAGLGGTAWMP